MTEDILSVFIPDNVSGLVAELMMPAEFHLSVASFVDLLVHSKSGLSKSVSH